MKGTLVALAAVALAIVAAPSSTRRRATGVLNNFIADGGAAGLIS
jgi:hypothetical protein